MTAKPKIANLAASLLTRWHFGWHQGFIFGNRRFAGRDTEYARQIAANRIEGKEMQRCSGRSSESDKTEKCGEDDDQSDGYAHQEFGHRAVYCFTGASAYFPIA